MQIAGIECIRQYRGRFGPDRSMRHAATFRRTALSQIKAIMQPTLMCDLCAAPPQCGGSNLQHCVAS